MGFQVLRAEDGRVVASADFFNNSVVLLEFDHDSDLAQGDQPGLEHGCGFHVKVLRVVAVADLEPESFFKLINLCERFDLLPFDYCHIFRVFGRFSAAV